MAAPSTTIFQVLNATKSFGARELFSKASFAVNSGEHIGVIGPNGAGKTTLFKMIVGQEEFDSGEVVRSQGLRIGYLAQNDDANSELSVNAYTTEGSLLKEWEIKRLALGLGIREDQWARPVAELSGGYRMRVKLTRLLAHQPNLLMLDEPTNYLDIETLLVLERFLLNYEGAFLLISHDREFLRRTTDHTLEVEGGDIVKFPGNIDDYFEQKEILRAQLESRALSVETKRREIMDFVNRFGAKASKARQAQSRLKTLAKLEHVEVKAAPLTAKIKIPDPIRVAKLALDVQDAEAGYGKIPILKKMNFQMLGGDRIGVVGVNGAGKTTLLKSLAGEIPLLSGEIKQGFGLEIAYFGQIVSERLDPNLTVYESLNSVTTAQTSPQEILDMAGSLLFQGEAVQKRVRVLSGGEKSRVALGQVLLRRASCLLLDEPTNHLDFYTVEALTQALAQFPGTVITVSHDRSFVARVCTKILEVKDGTAWVYPGTYDEYLWSLEQKAARGESSVTSPTPARTPNDASPTETKPAKLSRGLAEKRLREIRQRTLELNRRITREQSEMTALGEKLASAKGPEVADLSRSIADTQKKIDELESEWLQLAEEEETLKA